LNAEFGLGYTRLQWVINEAREQALSIQSKVAAFEEDVWHHKSIFLLQQFILERVSYFNRYALNNYFGISSGSDTVHPVTWVAAWSSFLFAFYCFMLYWILAWGASNGGEHCSRGVSSSGYQLYRICLSFKL